jgi:hypothetical protein
MALAYRRLQRTVTGQQFARAAREICLSGETARGEARCVAEIQVSE